MKAPKRKTRNGDALGFLGLARRAGAVVPGVDGVRRAVKAGEAAMVLIARDAAAGQVAKVEGVLRHHPVPVRWVPDRATLGRAVGSGPLTVVAITDRSFAEPLERTLSATRKAAPAAEEEAGI
jgi:ribosomal protein L7Ae-like RNA K-turn-binding protein